VGGGGRERAGRENPARARILAAGAEVFGSYGFTKATIQEIAARAHVSKPLFYRQFANKQAVFEAVVELVFGEWRAALVEDVAASSGGTGESLRILFASALDYGRRRPLLGRLLNRDSQLLLSTQSDIWDRACDALRELIAEVLVRGVEAGEVRTDLPIEAMADLMAEMNFAYANRQLHTGEAIPGDRVDAIVACMLDGVFRAPSTVPGSSN